MDNTPWNVFQTQLRSLQGDEQLHHGQSKNHIGTYNCGPASHVISSKRYKHNHEIVTCVHLFSRRTLIRQMKMQPAQRSYDGLTVMSIHYHHQMDVQIT